MRLFTLATAIISFAHAGDAAAAQAGGTGLEHPSQGLFFGPEAGLVEHHFYISERNPDTGLETGRYYRSWSAGAGLFVGYDLPVTDNWLIGIEASVIAGGTAPEARFADGSFYRAEPEVGVKVAGRIVRRLGRRTMVYGTLGYGGHQYDVQSAGVDEDDASGHSFTIGAGVEHRVSRTLGIRLDFKHLDNQMSQLLIGLPIRF